MEHNVLAFREDLRSTLLALVPRYIMGPHDERDDKIKPADGTSVGSLDHIALTALREVTHRHFPGSVSIGEEDDWSQKDLHAILRATDNMQDSQDGLDGTGNRAAGLLSYGAAGACRRGGKILWAWAFRPADEKVAGYGFYFATKEHGAQYFCGEHSEYHEIFAGDSKHLSRPIVMLEGSSKKFYVPPITNVGQRFTTRPSCSSCVASTTVAWGRASALVTVNNKPWDNWPSIGMIEAAGGIVTKWDGSPWTPDDCGNIVAAGNRKDLAAILDALA